MTQYLISVHHTGPYPDPTTEEARVSFAATGAFTDKIKEAGQWVFVGGLEARETATTVDGRGDEVIVTDGAFPESKEYLAGFWVVEVADLDEALKLGAEASKACGEPVVVRPFA